MRILQVIDVRAPVGGAQRSVLDTIDQLEAAGHEVIMAHGDDAVCGDRFVSVRYSDPDLHHRINEFDPQVVHVHEPSVPIELKPSLDARRVVHSLHNFDFGCSTGSKYFRDGSVCGRPHGFGCFGAALGRGCLHRFDPRPALTRFGRIQSELPRLRGADGFIVHSRFMHGVTLQNGIPPDRVSVVPLFTRVAVDDSPPPAPGRTVVFVGRLTRDKGLDLLIQALAAQPGAWDRLLVAGDGWDRERCAGLALRRGIADRIEFLGQLDAHGVRRTLIQARVLAVPSRWPEPFGIVGLEAMAVGRPVVATAVGGIPEWLDDDRTGILVPPDDAAALGDAIASILANPARAAELGAEGRRQAERFSPKAHVEGLLAAYERAMGKTRYPASEARVV